MARWDLIHGLPVQNPPSLECGASDLVWSRVEGLHNRVAKIPFARVDDFVRGESNNKDCPTRFHVEARRRPSKAVNGILEYIMIENSDSNLIDSVHHGGELEATGSAAPSLLETRKAFTIKGMQVIEKELEGLSNHYELLYNQRKAKLSCEQKSIYDGKLKEVQLVFDLGAELVGLITDLKKGKKIEAFNDDSIDEFKRLHDSSLSKAAELAAGFASALAGLSPNDMTKRTCGRLDALHSEGVHRISEMCCFAVTRILMLGKSITSNANKVEDEEIEETINIDWPEDYVEKATIIRSFAQSMIGNMEAVSNSFITGISEVAEAYVAAIKGVTADSQDIRLQKSVQEKASAFMQNLRADHSTAVAKMQDGIQFLTYLVLSSSMPAAG